MSRKKKSPLDHIWEICGEIRSEVERWKEIRQNGCSDPYWPDGVNLNLVRNHVICYKRQTKAICEENSLFLPEEYYISIPPLVPDSFMARKDDRRIQRMVFLNREVTFQAPVYQENKLCFSNRE